MEMNLAKKLDLTFSSNLRTFNKASKTEQVYGELGLDYKVLKYLSVAGSYRFTQFREDNDLLYPRHKWIADLRSTVNITNRVTVSGRFRFQRQDKTYIEDPDDEIPDYYGRLRFKLIYKTPAFPLNPYMAYETFARMFEQSEKRFEKFRFSAGTEYKFNKKHSVELEYIFEKDNLPKLKQNNILCISYNLKL
jgi:opacity protein-like surface antigen